MKCIKTKKTTAAAVHGGFFLIGMTFSIFGATIPVLIHDYQIDLGRAGLFIAFMAFGRMFCVLLSGIAVDAVGRKTILTVGIACITAGLLGIGSISWYWGAVMLAALAGAGHGMIDTAGSAVMADIYPDSLSSAMNRTHMFFGIGCLVCPLIAGIILTYSANWRIVYYIAGLMGAVILIYTSRQSFPYESSPIGNNSVKNKGSSFFSLELVLLCTIMFLYSGVGHSINTWINKYMGDIVKFSILYAAGSQSVYNIGLTFGRLMCSIFSKRFQSQVLILLSSIGVLGSICLVLFVDRSYLIVLGLGLTGLFFGGLFPMAIALAGQSHPRKTGTVTGILVTAAALGSMTIPAATGFAAEYTGLQESMRLLVIFVLILVLVGYILNRKKQKSPLTPISAKVESP